MKHTQNTKRFIMDYRKALEDMVYVAACISVNLKFISGNVFKHDIEHLRKLSFAGKTFTVQHFRVLSCEEKYAKL